MAVLLSFFRWRTSMVWLKKIMAPKVIITLNGLHLWHWGIRIYFIFSSIELKSCCGKIVPQRYPVEFINASSPVAWTRVYLGSCAFKIMFLHWLTLVTVFTVIIGSVILATTVSNLGCLLKIGQVGSAIGEICDQRALLKIWPCLLPCGLLKVERITPTICGLVVPILLVRLAVLVLRQGNFCIFTVLRLCNLQFSIHIYKVIFNPSILISRHWQLCGYSYFITAISFLYVSIQFSRDLTVIAMTMMRPWMNMVSRVSPNSRIWPACTKFYSNSVTCFWITM